MSSLALKPNGSGRAPVVHRFCWKGFQRVWCYTGDLKLFYQFLSVLALSGAFGGLFAASPFEPDSDNVGLTVNQTDALIYPYSMTLSGILSGEARVMVSVDASGHLTDTLVVGYTNVAFADTAVNALKRWTYEPARAHGMARTSRACVYFIFKNQTGIITQLLPGMTDYRAVHGGEEHYVYAACRLRELDRIPIPSEVVQPVLPKGGLSAKRSVTVEFYIDVEGKVRMPAIERSEPDDGYAAAAVRAVEQWRFEPPMRRGQPTLVLARQEFSFVPKP